MSEPYTEIVEYTIGKDFFFIDFGGYEIPKKYFEEKINKFLNATLKM